jgi:hypothetical protein
MYVTETISLREYHFVLQTVAYRVTVGDFCLENSTIKLKQVYAIRNTSMYPEHLNVKIWTYVQNLKDIFALNNC